MNRSPVSVGYAVHVFVYLIRKIISDWDMADARQKDRLLTKEGEKSVRIDFSFSARPDLKQLSGSFCHHCRRK